MEIHHIKDTDFKRVGGKSFDSYSPEANNARMKRVWDVLSDVSKGTLNPEFDRLYWFGGAWSPAYDIKGDLGKVPPSSTVKTSEKDLELLLPVYKSLVHRGNVRPAILGVWSHEDQVEVAQVFMQNFEYFNTQLESGDVYAVMKRPDSSLYASRYDSPQDFRADYFSAIDGEQGQVVVVTNDQEYALKCYQKEETENELSRISHGETNVPFMVRRLPKFVNRGWVGKQVASEYETIEDAISQNS